ncbi:MAG: FAD-dependent oxidoreductase [Segetibacter sp.]|nr:FAD-dependent oxidoreductase [Segetibacter sp.]
MIKSDKTGERLLPVTSITSDLVVVGGGMSGVCSAITAARGGIKVVLVQDRPVLGGNSSSEIRLWILGATSHMGNNNRWAREGGVIDEILVENTYRNPEGNAIIFDTVLLDKVASEPNITLLLNTAVYSVEKKDDETIKSVRAFCSQNQNEYELKAPVFCDASGDGIVGFLAGAAFRMGAESKEEFGEKFAPSKEYGELLGHSLYFYSKDTGKPVKFVSPSFALNDISKIPRYRSFNTKEYGCRLWWLEYGGRLDTVHQTEEIKWELWKVVYGVWNHIKNSGEFPEAETLTLEWVGMIPGKRESRRFEGDYILKQQDIVEQKTFEDAVAYGGWSIDLHPADGVFSEKPGCNQWHGKGIYQIPYRCLYARNMNNLFFAGRIISSTHVAFGSARVMATGAYTGQVVGEAAALCAKKNVSPKELLSLGFIKELQSKLLSNGHFIPGITMTDEADLVQHASVTASSTLLLNELPENGVLQTLDESVIQMIPVKSGNIPGITVHAYTDEPTTLEIELRTSISKYNYTPENILETKSFPLHNGKNCLQFSLNESLQEDGYAYLCFKKNPLIKVPRSANRITGILSLFNSINLAVSNYGKQQPTEDIGVDAFEFWCPKRRPAGENIAIKFSRPLDVFGVENIRNGIARPTNLPNAWVADVNDKKPFIKLSWESEQPIKRLELSFDTDFDHPMESVLMSHPENVMPFCIRNYEILNDRGEIVFKKEGNYQTRNSVTFSEPLLVKSLTLNFEAPNENIPASLFEIRAYAE